MVFVLIMLISGMAMNVLSDEEVTLTGVVQATNWENEKVIEALLVVTYEEENDEGEVTTYTEDYIIIDDEIGQQLFEHDGETVEVVGIVEEDDNDILYIYVKSFQVINDEEEE